MLSYPLHRTRLVHRLDGLWSFAYLGEQVDLGTLEAQAVVLGDRAAVPGVFDASPAYAGRRGTAVYGTRVRTTPGRAGRLHRHGLGLWARVLVDGAPVAELGLPYSGVWVDVPPAGHSERDLRIVVDNRFDRRRMPLFEPFFDFYAYGGIYRSVDWHEVPALSLDRAEVMTEDLATGRIRVRVRLHGPAPERVTLRVGLDAGPAQTLADLPVAADGSVSFALQVPEPTPWTPQRPALHTLRLELGEDDLIERFGLRTVRADGQCLLLNGEPLKLLGYCRHEAHPQFGPALPLAQLVQDLQLLRDLGCNFVRGSHYPQDQRFLDLCDELGFLVWEESLGWGQKVDHFADPAFAAAQVQQTELMVRNSINHPCVILWGFLNEGESKAPPSRPLYARLVDTIRSLDRNRPVTYATMFPFDDCNLDLVDVVSVNCYPGWYANPNSAVRPLDEIVPHLHRIQASLKDRGLGNKPFLLSEIGAGAIYGWRDPLKAHWSEEYQADYLGTVCREVRANPGILGVALWQFCDGRTYANARALGRPRAFNNKGTLDEYRRPKGAYAVVKAHFGGPRP